MGRFSANLGGTTARFFILPQIPDPIVSTQRLPMREDRILSTQRFGFDTAENEPAKFLQKFAKFLNDA